jgi:hypothetical protein
MSKKLTPSKLFVNQQGKLLIIKYHLRHEVIGSTGKDLLLSNPVKGI